MIAGSIEFADDFLEIDLPVTGRTEIPSTMRSTKRKMTAEDAVESIQHYFAVLDVDMEDPVRELPDECGWIDALPEQVAGIEVETETGMVADGFQCALGSPEVEGDFGWMNFQSKINAKTVELVQDRRPDLGEFSEAIVNHLVRN